MARLVVPLVFSLAGTLFAACTQPTVAVPTPPSSPMPTTPSPAPPVPRFDHVFTIVDENTSYESVIGNPAAPYINDLARHYGLATNYHGLVHPSSGNYFGLTAASTFGRPGRCTVAQCSYVATNIADRIEEAGLTWKAYVESMPFPCDSESAAPYDSGLNVFLFYQDIYQQPVRCRQHDVLLNQLAVDLQTAATTPSYAWITPNICHDMHDCSVGAGDVWLEAEVSQIIASPAWRTQRCLLLVTWDEDDFTPANHVATLLVAKNVKPGYWSSARYEHYSLLRSTEEALGLRPLTTSDAAAISMGEFFL